MKRNIETEHELSEKQAIQVSASTKLFRLKHIYYSGNYTIFISFENYLKYVVNFKSKYTVLLRIFEVSLMKR